MNILITGASGLVGSQIVRTLNINVKHTPIAALRNLSHDLPENTQSLLIEDLSSDNDWSGKLDNIDVVIHTAARVHVMNETTKDPLSEFRRVNVDGTLNLAHQASISGVKRFIFLSSIKVNGEFTKEGNPFSESDIPNPVDPYGISKFETELGLYNIAEKSEMEVVCIRPTLVYGPGVKANFLNMMCWLQKGIPLPFGAFHNKRSFVGLDNLVDLILTCIDNPAAANETFLVSDNEDMSTTELLKRVGSGLKRTPRLLPINQKVIEFGLTLLGKKDFAQRLCGSLQVDITKAKNILNWEPPFTVDKELQRTTEYFIRLGIL